MDDAVEVWYDSFNTPPCWCVRLLTGRPMGPFKFRRVYFLDNQRQWSDRMSSMAMFFTKEEVELAAVKGALTDWQGI